MSDVHNEHESPIKTPKQLIAVVIAAFVVPITVIILLVSFVGYGGPEGAGSTDTAEAVVDRIKPVASLELRDPNAPRVYKTGEQVYTAVCAACHAAGVAGAPKVGDKAAWAPRIKEGMDAVHNFALKGKGVMPPKGGYAGPDADVIAAADYMVNASK